MPEITIKYKNLKTLQALMDIAKYFDFTITTPAKRTGKKNALPIDFAEKPDVTALSGIWKDREISLEELRQKAWGDRL